MRNWQAELYCVVQEGDIDGMQNILANHAAEIDVNATNLYGYTALHLAVTRYNIDVIELLLEYGADFDLPDLNDRTPMDIAFINGYTDAYNLFINHNLMNAPFIEYGVAYAHLDIDNYGIEIEGAIEGLFGINRVYMPVVDEMMLFY